MKFSILFLNTLHYFFGHPSTTANPNGVTINNFIVNVTVVAPDTAPARKKKSKKERAEAKLASKLLSQPVIHGYAMCSNVNMKKQKWDVILKDDNVRSSLHRDANNLDRYY